MTTDPERVHEANAANIEEKGVAVRCTPSFFSGPWSAVALPVSDFLRTRYESDTRAYPGRWIPYGPAHLMSVVWAYGIHDYLKEPWTVSEFILRAQGSARRHWSWDSHGLRFDLEPDSVRCADRIATLTWSEFVVLRTLATRLPSPASRELLLLELKGTSIAPASRIVDTLVKQVRSKLRFVAQSAVGNPVQNVRGVGYFLS